jgi:hypothetical protein
MSKLVGSRLHRQARLVHQGDNRLPEVVAVTPSKPRRDPPMKARLERGPAQWLRFGKRHHGDA